MNDDWLGLIRNYIPSSNSDIQFDKVELMKMFSNMYTKINQDKWGTEVPVNDTPPPYENDYIEEDDEVIEYDEWVEDDWDEEDEHLNWETDLPVNPHRGWDIDDLPRPIDRVIEETRINPFGLSERTRRVVSGVRNPDRRLVKEVKIDETVTELDDDYLKRLGVK